MIKTDDVVKTYYWDPETQTETEVVVDLEAVIRNPSGYKMDHLGLVLLNRERRSRGLTEYVANYSTGTFDEVSNR